MKNFHLDVTTTIPPQKKNKMSNEKKTGCLGYVRDYTTQFFGDYNQPL